ncbi:MAG: hypothetical protein ACFFD4_07730 [Candidatus Odinarchaeota archaeon]
MQIAYADPPYIGCANRYPEKQEVDHKELVDRLCREYDCWALSSSSSALKRVLSLCPDDVRVAAWVKPFCSFKPNVNPAFAWEPVVFWHPRDRDRYEETIRDWVSANITLKKGVVGAKPPKFCFWLFNLLGMEPEDEFYDLFPGTGIVTECWNNWQSQKRQHQGVFNLSGMDKD